MANIWFTSDLHMNHRQEFLWGPRGFTNEKEMNEAIVERWNKVVKPEDTVWNLGDIALNDINGAIPYLKALNGTQFWLLGNHDTKNKIDLIVKECPNIRVYRDRFATTLKIGDANLYISHYPTLTANFDQKQFGRHVIALYGHTHQQTNWLQLENPFLYHVGLDSHECAPVHFDEVITDIRNRWNELGLNTNSLRKDDTYGIPDGIRPGFECV